MCGIFGELRFDLTDVPLLDPVQLRTICNMMHRRGPNQAGVWTDDIRCSLGFRRLSILDLSLLANQPMHSVDGRYVLVYNGELYNFRELRQELENGGFRFRSTGDTEVVLNSLIYWGEEALIRFNGMFALGFYDKTEQKLLLARDHAGIKPLYYLSLPQGFVFASQYDQVLAHPLSQQLKVSESAVALYLRLGYIPAPYGILEHTAMLQSGQWIQVYADRTIVRGSYFEFPMQQRPDLYGNEAFEAVDSVISAAVRRQIVSDVPVGTFLSGGIDSPLVASKMQELSNHPVKAFTIGTKDDLSDESRDASHYARVLGVHHTLKYMTADDALAILNDVVAATSEPFADYSIFPTMLVSRLASEEVVVMLSGDGGDELFWGYSGRFGSVLGRSLEFEQPLWMRRIRWWLKRASGLSINHSHLQFSDIGQWYFEKHRRIFEEWLQWMFPALPTIPNDFSLFNYSGWKIDDTAQWMRWNEYLGHLSMVLLKVDRASMYHSLEVRVPLLDRDVVEIASRVDWRSCLDVDRNIGKRPLRAGLNRHIPQITVPKRGFSVPMAEWLRGPLSSIFIENVLERQEILGYQINKKRVWQYFNRHKDGESDFARGLWVLLSLSLWERRYMKSRVTVG